MLERDRLLMLPLGRGGPVIAAPVFAELLASPSRNEVFLDSFLRDTGISVDWGLNERVWRSAGRAFSAMLSGADNKETLTATHPRGFLDWRSCAAKRISSFDA